jgi:hypothetical protein
MISIQRIALSVGCPNMDDRHFFLFQEGKLAVASTKWIPYRYFGKVVPSRVFGNDSLLGGSYRPSAKEEFTGGLLCDGWCTKSG